MNRSGYVETAYSQENLCYQPAYRPRSGLTRLTGRRLPWGSTQQVVPDIFMSPEPAALRHVEEFKNEKAEKIGRGTYERALMEDIDFHDRCDHEHYRHALMAPRSRFWLLLNALGKFGFLFIFIVIGFIASLTIGLVERGGFVKNFFYTYYICFQMFGMPSLCAWWISSLVIYKPSPPMGQTWQRPQMGAQPPHRHDYPVTVPPQTGNRKARTIPRV